MMSGDWIHDVITAARIGLFTEDNLTPHSKDFDITFSSLTFSPAAIYVGSAAQWHGLIRTEPLLKLT